jgi:hypothetical protein
MHVTMLTAIGTPGEFVRSCDHSVHITAGTPTPANSPAGGGFRAIPDRTCIEQFVLVPPGQHSDYSALHVTWETSNSVRRADGHTLAFFNPYFQLPIDVCYEVTAAGDQASGGACGESTNDGQVTGVTFDSPSSVFNGAGHFVDINANQLGNSDGPEVWYTDAFGRNGQTSPFPGSIRQRLSKTDNKIGVDAGGPVIGGNRSYAGAGVHAPN